MMQSCSCPDEYCALHGKPMPYKLTSTADTMTTKSYIDEKIAEIEVKSERINDSLWYVNPEDIRTALQEAYSKGREDLKEGLKLYGFGDAVRDYEVQSGQNSATIAKLKEALQSSE